jgi:UDP-3-O-[3-hydroxymyristoyl] N-acetylglucosamine deacetylase
MLVQKKTITRPNFISFNPPRFKTAKKQKTILKTINFSGKGLHSNNKVNMTISPAPPETGVVFRITNNKKRFEIKASFLNVSSTKLCTTISDEFGNSVSTIEHILSALYGMELDNIFIDLDNKEVPVYDGSAQKFIEEIEKAGTIEQDSYKSFIKILKKVEVRDGNKLARVLPFDYTLISSEINYKNQVIGKQSMSILLNKDIYISQISKARTFGLLEDVDALRKAGLALGGGLDNAIVVDKTKILNEEGLRYSDEFIRHKILDFIGDIALSGKKIIGSFFTSQSGHDLNVKLLKKIFESEDNYKIITSN